LEQIFAGSRDEVMATASVFSHNDWHKDDLLMGIKRVKAKNQLTRKNLLQSPYIFLTTFSTEF